MEKHISVLQSNKIFLSKGDRQLKKSEITSQLSEMQAFGSRSKGTMNVPFRDRTMLSGWFCKQQAPRVSLQAGGEACLVLLGYIMLFVL